MRLHFDHKYHFPSYVGTRSYLSTLVHVQPNMQSNKFQKEGTESEQFWELLGEKTEYSSLKIASDVEGDPHLFSCTLSKGTTPSFSPNILVLSLFISINVRLYIFVN